MRHLGKYEVPYCLPTPYIPRRLARTDQECQNLPKKVIPDTVVEGVVFGREFTKSADVLIYLYLDHFPFVLLLCRIIIIFVVTRAGFHHD